MKLPTLVVQTAVDLPFRIEAGDRIHVEVTPDGPRVRLVRDLPANLGALVGMLADETITPLAPGLSPSVASLLRSISA